jgi:hypothetical protein
LIVSLEEKKKDLERNNKKRKKSKENKIQYTSPQNSACAIAEIRAATALAAITLVSIPVSLLWVTRSPSAAPGAVPTVSVTVGDAPWAVGDRFV